MRRQLVTGLLVTIVLIVILGVVYPLVVTGVGQVAFSGKANGSFVTVNGKQVGSSLIGQAFTDAKGRPISRYFQSRPSFAGTGYDALASGASNLGPSNPLLVGFIPNRTITKPDGQLITGLKRNPYATKADPTCVPTAADGTAITTYVPGQAYAKDASGQPVCYPGTVAQRAIAYRALNGLPASTAVPVDAVTSSASGLDPDISVANADLQVARVAKARHLPVATVVALVARHTEGRQLGVLGEKVVHVLALNLDLDQTR